jgi:hypothetical protein
MTTMTKRAPAACWRENMIARLHDRRNGERKAPPSRSQTSEKCHAGVMLRKTADEKEAIYL